MKKGYQLIIALFSLFLMGCEEYYIPELKPADQLLVVEGQLTNKNEPFTVQVSRTVSFDSRLNYQAERKATVNLLSWGGEIYGTKEISNGVYKTTSNVNAKVGEFYYLQIITKEGVEYRSEVEVLLPPTEIAAVQLVDTIAREINYDYWGDPFVKDQKGIQVQVLPEKPTSENVGFIYRWNALVNYYVLCGTPPNEYSFYCWKNMSTSQIYVYDHYTGDTGNKLILDDLSFLSYYALSPQPIDSSRFYLGDVENLLPIAKNYTTGFYYRVQQYTVSNEGASFWKQVKRQSEATGKLFDPVEEQLTTNIYCVSDSTIKALGFFNTASVTEKIIKVGLLTGSLNNYYQIDYMPTSESHEDCYLSIKPDFWF